MSSKAKWDVETTIKFIQLYKLHQCLWKFESPEYKIKKRRDAAYKSIVQEMNITGFGTLDVKNKIKNLRSTYKQEMKKIQESKKPGAGFSNVYTSNIKWLEEMQEVFSEDFEKNVYENMPLTQSEKSKRYREKLKKTNPEKYLDMKKKNISRAIKAYHSKKKSLKDMLENSIQPPENTIQSTSSEQSANAICLPVKEEYQPEDSSSDTSSHSYNYQEVSANTYYNQQVPVTVTTSTTAKAKKRGRENSQAISDLKQLKNEDVNSVNETIFDVFGRSVALQLKNLTAENALLAQNDIQNILTEYGIKELRQKSASHSSSSN